MKATPHCETIESNLTLEQEARRQRGLCPSERWEFFYRGALSQVRVARQSKIEKGDD